MIAECFEDNGTKPKTLINDGENMIIANEAIYYQITWVGKSNQNLSTFVRFDNKFDEVLTYRRDGNMRFKTDALVSPLKATGKVSDIK